MAIELRYAGTRHYLTPGTDRTQTLARVLWLEGPLPPRQLCLGIGQCGLCRVLFHSPPPEPTVAEKRILFADELAKGVRLACRHRAEDGMVVEVEAPAGAGLAPGQPAASTTIANNGPEKASKIILLSIDLGTTSVAWKAEDLDGKPLAEGQAVNPQVVAGSEVMARLAEASRPEGLGRLQKIMLEHVHGIVRDLGKRGWQASRIGLAANPAMTALFLGKDISGLVAAPYRLDDAGARWESLPGLPPVWTAPQISPFVGGDLAAGLALLLDADRPFLLADMGTNGEFLLVTGGELLAASVPLGPALEGVGMSLGALAGPGVALAFHLTPMGLESRGMDKTPLTRISGTGYISLIHNLLDAGLLDQQGLFISADDEAAWQHNPTARPDLLRLGRKMAKNLTRSEKGELRLPLESAGSGLYLSGEDVEAMLKVKAAFRLAVDTLIREAALPDESGEAGTSANSGTAGGIDKLRAVYLAGALGRHAPVASLERLGFLPEGGTAKTRAVGNASLDGMALMLRHLSRAGVDPSQAEAGRDVPLIRRVLELVRSVRVVNLTDSPDFYRRYLEEMRFGPGL